MNEYHLRTTREQVTSRPVAEDPPKPKLRLVDPQSRKPVEDASEPVEKPAAGDALQSQDGSEPAHIGVVTASDGGVSVQPLSSDDASVTRADGVMRASAKQMFDEAVTNEADLIVGFAIVTVYADGSHAYDYDFSDHPATMLGSLDVLKARIVDEILEDEDDDEGEGRQS